MTRPIRALIDTYALEKNLSLLRAKSGNRFLWGVVKANAYGHGLIGLLPTFDNWVDGLALLDPKEGVDIRKAGWAKAVLLIEGIFAASDIEMADEYGFETVIHNERQIEWLEKAELKNTLRVHLKCNTGMNRLGFRPEAIPQVLFRLNNIPKVEVVDLLAHFANAEVTYGQDKPVTVQNQLSALTQLRGLLPMCLSNTGGILWHEAGDEAVRAGIAMYGVSPDGNISSASLGIDPVMTLESEIIAFQDLQPGEACGYGSKFIAHRPTRLAVVACGYADGYPRLLHDHADMLVCGKRARVVGRVCMDQLMLDVTDIPEAEVGMTDTIFGKDGENTITVDELASFNSTIHYEMVWLVGKRVPRIYLRHGEQVGQLNYICPEPF